MLVNVHGLGCHLGPGSQSWQGHWFHSGRPLSSDWDWLRYGRYSWEGTCLHGTPCFSWLYSLRRALPEESRGFSTGEAPAPACRVWNVNLPICFFLGYTPALVVIQRHQPCLQWALIWGVAKPCGPEYSHTPPILLTFHPVFSSCWQF